MERTTAVERSTATLPKAPTGRPRRATLVVVEHDRASNERGSVEAFIEREFALHFGARVTRFMPRLLALHDERTAVHGAVGFRAAASEPLFLETYTQCPIELAIRERFGASVPREQIVEIGSLACRDARAAMRLIVALVPRLLESGYTWAVFTGADTLNNIFRRLRLLPLQLCTAEPRLLGAAQADWGTYYDHHPVVMTGRLIDGLDALASTPRVQ